MKKKNPKVIVIIGRRWFNKGPGNTYHSTQISVDGKWVEGIDFAYGGDQHYVDTSLALLCKNGILNVPAGKRPHSWCYDNGIEVSYTATNVSRKSDL